MSAEISADGSRPTAGPDDDLVARLTRVVATFRDMDPDGYIAAVATDDGGVTGVTYGHLSALVQSLADANSRLAGFAAVRADNEPGINWPLITDLATKPHKHLNITPGCEFTCLTHEDDHWIGEVEQEARTVQHLLDRAGIPEGKGYDAHIDARTYLLLAEVSTLRERLARITDWHSRETGPHGMVGDYCNECGSAWPCDTRRLAEGTYNDKDENR